MQAPRLKLRSALPSNLFEVTWDGLRCLVFGTATASCGVQDRGLNDLTPTVLRWSQRPSASQPGSVIDGELVATDNDEQARLSRAPTTGGRRLPP